MLRSYLATVAASIIASVETISTLAQRAAPGNAAGALKPQLKSSTANPYSMSRRSTRLAAGMPKPQGRTVPRLNITRSSEPSQTIDSWCALP